MYTHCPLCFKQLEIYNSSLMINLHCVNNHYTLSFFNKEVWEEWTHGEYIFRYYLFNNKITKDDDIIISKIYLFKTYKDKKHITHQNITHQIDIDFRVEPTTDLDLIKSYLLFI